MPSLQATCPQHAKFLSTSPKQALCGNRELAGAPAPAAALAALEALLEAAGNLADDAAAWPTIAPLLRALALQAGQHYLDAVGGARPSSSAPEHDATN